jgi:ABC-2 type transport system permease protein
LFSFDLTILRDTYRLLLASVAYGLVIIFSAGMLILALSSLSRNSRYVALFWLGIWIVSGIVATVLQSVDQAQRRQASFNRAMAGPSASSTSQTLPQRRRPARGGTAMHRWSSEDFEAEEIEAGKTNWRPLVSYTANLSRVGSQLLGTDACWRTLSELEPAYGRKRFLFRSTGPQYPWYWSAGVLAGLFGLSACILGFAVRSLDRLR